MATLTDAFLADLDALSDGEEDVEKNEVVFKQDEKEVRRILFLRDACAVISQFHRPWALSRAVISLFSTLLFW